MSDEPIRVLIIDDEQLHAEAVAESLERVGYECVVATSGAAGARKINQAEFDRVKGMNFENRIVRLLRYRIERIQAAKKTS